MLWLCLVLVPWPALADLPAPLNKVELNDGECWVFLGDSITHQCLYTQYVEDYFYTRFPNMRPRFHNAGVGGAQAWDALQRFERDVAAYKPKYVTVLLGMNDGRYRPYDQEIFERYQRDMTELVKRIEEIGATPILMTPTMYDARAARARTDRQRSGPSVELYNSVLAYYGAWLREVAVESGHGFVDMYSPLNNLTLASRKKDRSFTLIKDAVHPGPSGQLVMANAILDDLGFRGQLSSIRLDVRGNDINATAKGGELTDVTLEGDELSFAWRAEALPFVVPPAAQQGADLVKLGHRMSREALTVVGLKPGRYELLINGESVGRFQHTALARHIELQGRDTPQRRQALQVVELNGKRNSGPVRKLRGEWSIFQRYARTKRDLEARPDNADIKARFAELEMQMEGREERIAKHEADAKSLEDDIYAHNQPQNLKFVIRRVRRGRAGANRPAANGSASNRRSSGSQGLPRPTGEGIVGEQSVLEHLFTREVGLEGGLTEGPAVAPDGSIYFSDIRRGSDPGVIHRFDPKTRRTTVFAKNSHKSNGLIFSSDGSLLACEGADYGGRQVSKWNISTGERTILTDRFQGGRYNSPNDLCLDAAGRIYFSDPRYIGHESRELDVRAIYRIDTDGSVREATRQVTKPNGLAISPDGKTLYVAEHDNGSDGMDPDAEPPQQGEMKIYSFRIDPANGTLHDRRVFVDFGASKGCDGMTVDADGNVYLTVRDAARPGVKVVSPGGQEVAFIPTGPQDQTASTPIGLPSNVEFGLGDEASVLYVTVDTSLYRIQLLATGFHRQFSHN